jgi:hypothetical protein
MQAPSFTHDTARNAAYQAPSWPPWLALGGPLGLVSAKAELPLAEPLVG